MSLFWPALVGATLIALVHLLTPRFRFMHKEGNPWLPGSAGVAIAYVFMDVFPHLAKSQGKLGAIVESSIYGFLTHHVYLVALAGFVCYLGIILLEMAYRHNRTGSEISFASAPATVRAEVASLAAYNYLIGYLLAEQLTHRPEPLILFAMAMAVHVAGLDGLLREHFPNIYDRTARFLFAASVVAGCITGIVVEIGETTLALWYALLAGGIIVVATVYELPTIRSPRQYGFFCAGAGVFSALILVIEYLGK